MLELILKNDTTLSYAEARDTVCKFLQGSKEFLENDIIVSDVFQDKNCISISFPLQYREEFKSKEDTVMAIEGTVSAIITKR